MTQKTFTHTIDGKVVATYKKYPLTRRTFKQCVEAAKRARRDARLVNILTK